MRITFLKLLEKPVTIQYPDERMTIPERARNRLFENHSDCIGCGQCVTACPVDCIVIETIKSTPDVDLGTTSDGQKKRLYVPTFIIDFGKCCYCGLCTYPCPTECLKMTAVFEFSEYERYKLIYNFSTMTKPEIDEARAKLKKYDEEQAAKKAAAIAAAAAQKKAAEQAASPGIPPVTPPPVPAH
jgi:NADH-quinone oxidoreductase subunit I